METLKAADGGRSANRARIVSLYSGDPPYTKEEMDQGHIETNCNFLDGTELLHQARMRFYNAFVFPRQYFNVVVKTEMEGHDRWSQTITDTLNQIVRDEREFIADQKDKFTSVILHGVGPMVWFDRENCLPTFVALDDIKFGSRSLVSLANVPWFTVMVRYTVAMLAQKTVMMEEPDPGWNLTEVRRLLVWAANQGVGGAMPTSTPYQAETMELDLKTDSGLYGSDIVPTIDVWHVFYHGRGGWYMIAIPDQECGTSEIYRSKESLGDVVDNVLALQVADGACAAPVRIHAVRGLGFMMYAPCHLMNRLTCKSVDATFESSCQLFKNVAPGDKERLQAVHLTNMGVIPEGLELVPRQDRYTADFTLLGGVMSMLRQKLQEKVSSYIADIDTGTDKEQTATEVAAKASTANAILTGMLGQSYMCERDMYREICRRMMIKGSTCGIAQKAQEQLRRRGIPEAVMNVDFWQIETTKVFGGGDQILGAVAANQLLQAKDLFDSEQQVEILRSWVQATTGDADLATRMVPLRPKTNVPRGTSVALNDAAQLFSGIPAETPPVSITKEYLTTLIELTKAQLQKLSQNPNGQSTDAEELLFTCEHMAKICVSQRVDKQIVQQIRILTSMVQKMVDVFSQKENVAQIKEQKAAMNGGGQPGMGMEQGPSPREQSAAVAKAMNDAMLSAQKVETEREKTNKAKVEAARAKVTLFDQMREGLAEGGGGEGGV